MTRDAPSLLVVFADQMRGSDMACAGNIDIRTPSLDHLADEGVLFTGCYANTPVCTPNRGSLLTGLYPTTHRAIGNDLPLPPGETTVADVSRRAGFSTGYVGKWHLDGVPRDRFTPPGPRRHGFDSWAAFNCQHDYFNPRYYRDTAKLHEPGGYEPVRQTDLALEFLDHLDDGSPFNLWLSWGPPHDPYHLVPDEFRQLYDPAALTLPHTFQPDTANPLAAGLDARRAVADYYAAITALDQQLGRLLTRLRELDRHRDTIVVFTSDHGDMLWSHGWLKKQLPYEESVHVPLIVRWPESLPAGTHVDDVVATVDLAPTLLDLLGLSFSEHVEGRNLGPYLRSATAPGDSAVLLANHMVFEEGLDQGVPEWRGLRTNRWTYAETVGACPWLLFDNDRDPLQETNLVRDDRYCSVHTDLSERLHRELSRHGDPFEDTAGMLAHYGLEATWATRQEAMKPIIAAASHRN